MGFGGDFKRWVANNQGAVNNPGPSPWAGGNQFGAMANNQDTGWGGLQAHLIGQFGQSGAFGPMGNPAILEAIMRSGNQMAAGGIARARTQAQLGGLDPAAAASYGLQAGIRGQSDTSNAVQQAILQQLMSQQQFGQNVLQGFINPQQQSFSQDWMNARQTGREGGGGGIGQLLGGIAGSALGGWMSPGGWWKGHGK